MSEEEKFLKILGKILKQLRKKDPNLRQSELAKRAGITQASLSLIERGKRSTSMETIRKIALGLGEKLSTIILFAEQLLEDSTS